MNTIIESNTEMNDDKNLKPVAKNRRQISMMKNRSKMKFTIRNASELKLPTAVDGSIKLVPSMANSLKMTRQSSIVMYRMKDSTWGCSMKERTVSLKNWYSDVCIMSSSLKISSSYHSSNSPGSNLPQRRMTAHQIKN